MKTTTIIVAFLLFLFANEVSGQYQQLNFKGSYRGGVIENPFGNEAVVDKNFMFNLGLEKRWQKHWSFVLSFDYIQFADRIPNGSEGGFLDLSQPMVRTRTEHEKYVEGALGGISFGPSFHWPWDFFDLSLTIQGGATQVGLDLFLETNFQIVDGESLFSRDAYQYERKIFPSISIAPELSLSFAERWAFLINMNYSRVFSDKKIKNFISVEEADISNYAEPVQRSIETKRRDIPDLNRVFSIVSLGVGIRFTII